MAQLVKNPPAMWGTWVWSLGWEDPWRRERLPTGLENAMESMQSQRVGHDWATFSSLHFPPHFSSSTMGLQIPKDLHSPKVWLALMPHSLECSPWTSSMGLIWEQLIFVKNAEWQALFRPADSRQGFNKSPRWSTGTMKLESPAVEEDSHFPGRETQLQPNDFPVHPTTKSILDSRIPIQQCNFGHCREPLKSRKSRNTWSNRQIWPWSAEWSRAKANSVLPREHTDHSKHPLPTTQEKALHMDITRWSIPKLDWYILCSQRWGSFIQSAKTRLGADCGSDHELLIAKFRLKLKKVGKTTKPFRYDQYQIPYDYTVEVGNRFKGLDW